MARNKAINNNVPSHKLAKTPPPPPSPDNPLSFCTFVNFIVWGYDDIFLFRISKEVVDIDEEDVDGGDEIFELGVVDNILNLIAKSSHSSWVTDNFSCTLIIRRFRFLCGF